MDRLPERRQFPILAGLFSTAFWQGLLPGPFGLNARIKAVQP
jgi:hypothetical protein